MGERDDERTTSATRMQVHLYTYVGRVKCTHPIVQGGIYIYLWPGRDRWSTVPRSPKWGETVSTCLPLGLSLSLYHGPL